MANLSESPLPTRLPHPSRAFCGRVGSGGLRHPFARNSQFGVAPPFPQKTREERALLCRSSRAESRRQSKGWGNPKLGIPCERLGQPRSILGTLLLIPFLTHL